MAQQTQIATMLPYYERWMKRFPDFEALARSPEEDILKAWEGLGYYSRARNLHRLAKALVAMSEPPNTPEEWAELPGIGPYTAAAVASIAQAYPAAVVDGNVVRILARLMGESRTFSGNGEAVKAFSSTARDLLDADAPGRHNESMMELGALICTPKNPACGTCPVAKYCRSFGTEKVGELPRIVRPATERVEVSRAFCIRGGSILLFRLPGNAKRLAGQYELPELSQLGWEAAGRPLAVKTRSITRHRISERIYRMPESAVPRGKLPEGYAWVGIASLDKVTLSGPHRRWIGELLKQVGLGA
jgi:A/G-specific adenine glycosylase